MAMALEESLAIGPQLQEIHACLRRQLPGLERIAAAIYDPGTDALTTFVHSTDGEAPLDHYQIPLAGVPSLVVLADSGRDRIVDDLQVFAGSTREHTVQLLQKGYRSSYTLPFFEAGQLLGFLFFDSRQPGYLTPAVVQQLGPVARLLARSLAHSLGSARLLRAALRVASRLTHYRDPETRGHLERMARYSRLIAHALAAERALSDEYIEFVLLFAPLHDIGKIAVPDSILLKRDRLTQQEFEVMKTHVTTGAVIVDEMVAELGLGGLPHVDVLRNVVLFHHEAVDGSGYPSGLKDEQIPLEARIVAVADVVDALLSKRPYKEAWPMDEAMRFLAQGAGHRFDTQCVAALTRHVEDVGEIRPRFADPTDAQQSREGYTEDL